jgi:hypothetical protein
MWSLMLVMAALAGIWAYIDAKTSIPKDRAVLVKDPWTGKIRLCIAGGCIPEAPASDRWCMDEGGRRICGGDQ